MPSANTMTQELEQGVKEILDFAKEQKKELLGLLDALYEARDQVSSRKSLFLLMILIEMNKIFSLFYKIVYFLVGDVFLWRKQSKLISDLTIDGN